MGRGRAKGKKLTGTDDVGSGEEEKIPAQKRRGRPLKLLKDEIDEDEIHKIEDDDSEDTSGLPDKEKNIHGTPNGRKRKKNTLAKEKSEPVKEENGNLTKPSSEEISKVTGFRNTTHRRKNKPRRAAEAVVECN